MHRHTRAQSKARDVRKSEGFALVVKGIGKKLRMAIIFRIDIAPSATD